MGIRIPVEDSAPSVTFEDVVASVFDALGEVPEFLDEIRLCFGDDAPIADESYSCNLGHGRLTERTCRTSQLLHGYSNFPGLHQVIEVERKVMYMRRGEVVKETREVRYAATNFSPRGGGNVVDPTSPRQAGAEVLNKLLRRHWMSENRHHYVRDNHWREDRGTWRTGHAAFVMFVLLAISLNLLRATSVHWSDDTPMTLRSMAAEHTIPVAPETLLQKPP